MHGVKDSAQGVENLNLQELNVKYVLVELKNRIEEEGGVDFPKVQHIPKIYRLM